MGRQTIINKICSPQLIEAINPKNRELMEDFLDYLKSVQRSPNTIEAYRGDLLCAFCWCVESNENRFFVDWTKRQVVKYQNYLIEDLQNSPARVKRVKSVLSSMANYVENILDDEYPHYRNIINKIESPVNQPVRQKTVLTDAQVEELLTRLTAEGKAEKACMLALACYGGRRKSELVRFRVSDFDDDHLICNGALYQSDPLKTKGNGAAGKMLKCYTLAKQFKPYLDEWLLVRAQKGIESVYLFPDRIDREKHRSKASLDKWAKQFSDILGIDFYWHSCRHYTVTNFKRAGLPDTVIQQYIGWSDISMVPVYVDLDADEQLSMYFDGGAENGFAAMQTKNLEDI